MKKQHTLIYYIRDKYLHKNKFQIAGERTQNDLFVSKYGLAFLEAPGTKRPFQNFKAEKNIPLSEVPLTDDHYLAMCEIGTPYCRVFNFLYLLRKSGEIEYYREGDIVKARDFGFDPYEVIISGGFINNNKKLVNIENFALGLAEFATEKTFNDTEDLYKYLEGEAKGNDETYIVSSEYGVISAIIDEEQLIKNGINIIDFLEKESECEEEHNFYTINIKRGISMKITVNSMEKEYGNIKLKTAVINPEATYDRLRIPTEEDEVRLRYNTDTKEGLAQKLQRLFKK